MEGEIWMRRRQKPEKRRFYCFHEHTKRTNRDAGTTVEGWAITSHQIGSKPEQGFIKDDDIKAFREKKRNIKLSDEEIAKLLLSGDIDAGVLQVIQKQEG